MLFDSLNPLDSEGKVDYIVSDSLFTTINYINMIATGFDESVVFIDPYNYCSDSIFDDHIFVNLKNEVDKPVINTKSKIGLLQNKSNKYNDKIIVIVSLFHDDNRSIKKFIDNNILYVKKIYLFDTAYDYALKIEGVESVVTTSSYYSRWKDIVPVTRLFGLNNETGSPVKAYIHEVFPNFKL